MYNVRGSNVFSNWNKTCYIATRKEGEVVYDDLGNEIKMYNKPKKYSFNIQPVNSYTDLMTYAEYGEKVDKMYKATIPYKEYIGKFNEGDIAYLEGKKPMNETEETYGIGGNYVVTSVRPQNTIIAIYFERLQK